MGLNEIKLIPIRVEGEVKKGENIAKLIVTSASRQNVKFEEGDILIITQKIVSKAEGRKVRLSDVKPGRYALTISKLTGKKPELVEIILNESKSIVRMSKKHLICETGGGLVCANAGVDLSNVDGGSSATLLPAKPDESARKIRDELKRITGKNVAIIISDTQGRPLRRGVINVAIGLSGLKPFKDYRGMKDIYGYTLKTTKVAIADELASAAELLMGQADESIPAVIIRNYKYEFGEEEAKELFRPREEDLFW